MVFNLVARNQDDRVKNIACLMNQEGQWSLAPVFDMPMATTHRATGRPRTR